MSYEIFYSMDLVKQDGRIFPFVLHGSNNCFGYGHSGKQKRERTYSLTDAFGNGKVFCKSGARSFVSIEEFAADLDEEGFKARDGTRFYIPKTKRGVLKHFGLKPRNYLFPDENNRTEIKMENEHLYEKGDIESAPDSLYYCNDITNDEKSLVFDSWSASAVNPHKVLEREEEWPLYEKYLHSLTLTAETKEKILAYEKREFMGIMGLPFHLHPINHKLRREEV